MDKMLKAELLLAEKPLDLGLSADFLSQKERAGIKVPALLFKLTSFAITRCSKHALAFPHPAALPGASPEALSQERPQSY